MLDQWAFEVYGDHMRRKWWLEEVILWWRWLIWVVGDLILRLRWRWGRWLIRNLVVQWSFTPLLMEDVQAILHHCESRSLSVDVLTMSFGVLHRGLPS
jgi:hypothetical protein